MRGIVALCVLTAGCFSEADRVADDTGTETAGTTGSGSNTTSATSTTTSTTTASTDNSTTMSTTTSTTTSSDSSGTGDTSGMMCMPPQLGAPDPCPAAGQELGPAPLRCGGSFPAVGNDVVTLSCGSPMSNEIGYGFEAATDGVYVFSTFQPDGTPTNTQLAVFTGDLSEELACDQRIGVAPPSELPDFYETAAVAVPLNQGQLVRVVIEVETSLMMLQQPFILSVAQQMDCGGDCCEEAPIGTEGCEIDEIATCVCAHDPICCDSMQGGWDQNCANLAVAACFAGCTPTDGG